MQTAGKLIVVIGEFAAGVERRQNHFNTGYTLFWMDVHRHAAAIVADRQRTVLVQHHIDPLGVPGESFVDAVVDHFLRQMVGPSGIGVHARALANWV